MIPIFNIITRRLQLAIENRVAAANAMGTEIDVVMWMGRAALELIGQAGLGHSFDSLVNDGEDE